MFGDLRVLGTLVSPAKATEPIKMSFWVWTRVGQNSPSVRCDSDLTKERGTFAQGIRGHTRRSGGRYTQHTQRYSQGGYLLHIWYLFCVDGVVTSSSIPRYLLGLLNTVSGKKRYHNINCYNLTKACQFCLKFYTHKRWNKSTRTGILL